MRRKHVKVELSKEARKELERYVKTGVKSVQLVNRAKIILELDEAEGRKPKSQVNIAEKIGVSRQAVYDAKQAFLAAENIATFLQRKKRETPPVEPKVTGELEAHIIALACGPVPQGYARWSIRLLADKCVELGLFDSISSTTIHRVLKKRNFAPI